MLAGTYPKNRAIFVALLYFIVGILWIYFSDTLVSSVAKNNSELEILQSYKGFFYVTSTAILLYILVFLLENRLKKTNILLRSIINNTPDAIFFKDTKGRYLLFNHGASTMTGKSEAEAIGSTDEALFSPDGAKKIRQMDQVVLQKGVVTSKEENLSTLGGKEKVFLVTKGPLYNKNGSLLGLFGISRDITREKQHENRLIEEKNRFHYLAHHDTLTNLPNRLRLIEILDTKTEKKAHEPFALMFIDLDGFKEVNDSYGHRFGDKLLIEFARLLKKLFSDETLIFRSGGDEFVLLASCHKDQNLIHRSMQKLITHLDTPFVINGVDVYITASIGIAFFPLDATNTEELLQNADAAMYNAKQNGKNTYSFFRSQFTDDALLHITLSTNLKKALVNNELTLYFQPQVNPNDTTIIGSEALIRWFSPQGAISPAEFIPIAEESGLIIEIGEFVLRESFQTAKYLADRQKLKGRIAVNVAAKQFAHIHFITTLKEILLRTQCNPQWIELELTERSIIANPEKVIHTLHELTEMGFHISIDDFGTGYSSLSYLKNLPVNKLKIDISFVRNIMHEPKNQTIVKTIIALAKGLNMEVLAEGVESSEEMQFLRDNGIDSIQGYYYYKPLPLESLKSLQ